jgi:hypothetical protein
VEKPLSLFFLLCAYPEHRPERSETSKGCDDRDSSRNKSDYSQACAHLHKKADDRKNDPEDDSYSFVDASHVFLHGISFLVSRIFDNDIFLSNDSRRKKNSNPMVLIHDCRPIARSP